MGGGGGSSGSQDDFWSVAKHLTAGGVAGAVSRTVVSPLERMKILFQVQPAHGAKYTSVWGTLAKIGREEGVVGFFKGNGTNVVRIAPYSAVQFASYERYKKMIIALQGEMDTPGRLLAGALAGITSATSTYPLDLVRTRLSAQADVIKYRGIAHATKLIMKEDRGFLALYRGIIPTLMGVAPYVAINFTTYETLRGWFAKRNDSGQPTVVEKLFCGGAAGAVAQTMTYPFDVIRRRMQVMGMPESIHKYTSTWDAIRTIVRNETYRGLFKGMIPNYLKVVPSISVSFVTYEWAKALLNPL